MVYAIARRVRKLRGSQDPVEYGDKLWSVFNHYFTGSEIRAEMAESGFQLIEYCVHECPEAHAVGRAV